MPASTSDAFSHVDYGAPFDDDDADIILRSSDDVDFRAYKVILSKSSPFFKELLSLPQSSSPPPSSPDEKDKHSAETYDGLPLIPFSENKSILTVILTLCYPIPEPPAPALEELVLILAAAQKYEMDRVSGWASKLFAESSEAQQHPAKAFALACNHRLEREARVAARMSLRKPMTLEALDEQLPFMDGLTIQRLWRYHYRCADEASDLAKPQNLTWIERRDGEVWDWTNPCSCGGTVYLFANNERWNCRPWWKQYMERVVTALKVLPCGETVSTKAMLRPSVITAANCATCRFKAGYSLSAFSHVLAAEVDRRTSQVELDLPF